MQKKEREVSIITKTKEALKQKAIEMSFREWNNAETIAESIQLKIEAGEIAPEQIEKEIEEEIKKTVETMSSFIVFILETIKENKAAPNFFETIFCEATTSALKEKLFIEQPEHYDS